MQRHWQQGGRGQHPPAERRPAHGHSRERRKQQQICKPPQQQCGHKAEPQHKPEENPRRADKVEQRVAVGLVFSQLHMAVERIGREGQQVFGRLLPGEHRRVLVLQQRILVMLTPVGGVDRHVAHAPVLFAEEVGPAAGQRKALVDVVLFIRRGIRRQHGAVEQPEPEHQPENKLVQRNFVPQRCPDAQKRERRRRHRHRQEEP